MFDNSAKEPPVDPEPCGGQALWELGKHRPEAQHVLALVRWAKLTWSNHTLAESKLYQGSPCPQPCHLAQTMLLFPAGLLTCHIKPRRLWVWSDRWMGRGTEGGTRWLRKETSAHFGENQMGQDIQGPFGSVASGGCGWSTLVARLPLHISIQPQPATWWQKVFFDPPCILPSKARSSQDRWWHSRSGASAMLHCRDAARSRRGTTECPKSNIHLETLPGPP